MGPSCGSTPHSTEMIKKICQPAFLAIKKGHQSPPVNYHQSPKLDFVSQKIDCIVKTVRTDDSTSKILFFYLFSLNFCAGK